MTDKPPEPTKDSEVKKLAPRFATGARKPHEEMRAGWGKGNIGPKNKPPRRK
jgi:hypothetical protein